MRVLSQLVIAASAAIGVVLALSHASDWAPSNTAEIATHSSSVAHAELLRFAPHGKPGALRGRSDP
jgi:hypothetical protein